MGDHAEKEVDTFFQDLDIAKSQCKSQEIVVVMDDLNNNNIITMVYLVLQR
jgi:hypothetical protein